MSEYRLSAVKFNAPAMDQLLRSPTGDVGVYMKKLGTRIMVMAKRLTGTKTGRLSKSIQMSQSRVAGGQQVRVFSNSKYAYLVHEGTKPHLIDPPGDRIMAFNSNGHRIYTRVVHHPGTRGKRYLTIPLRQVIR